MPAHAGGLGDAEIHDLHPAVVADHDVFRLQIAMDDVVLVHVLERIARCGGDIDRLADRHDLDRVQHVAERFAFEKLHDDIGPALVFDRKDLQQARMIERLADFLFALEARKEGRIAFEPHERHFHGDGLARFRIGRLEDRGHAAAADDAVDLEAVVQHIADFDLEGHGNLCFVKDGLTAEIAQRVDALDLNDLNRKIVVGAAPFGQLNQLAACFRRRFFGDEIQNLLFGDAKMQAVASIARGCRPAAPATV